MVPVHRPSNPHYENIESAHYMNTNMSTKGRVTVTQGTKPSSVTHPHSHSMFVNGCSDLTGNRHTGCPDTYDNKGVECPLHDVNEKDENGCGHEHEHVNGNYRIEPNDFFRSRPTRENVLRRLSEALMRRSLTMIDLSQRGLQSLDARLVKLALLQNASLTILKLGYNDLGDEGVTTLASGIAIHGTLESLDIGFNNVGDPGVRALADAFSPTKNRKNILHTLYLSGNSISHLGAECLAGAISRGCGLTRLHLRGNKIGPDGMKAIAQAISQNETENNDIMSGCQRGIQQLFMGGTNIQANIYGCTYLANMLQTNISLKILSLCNCALTDIEIGVISNAIAINSRLPLESLQLSFNNITCTGVKYLIQAVWKTTTNTLQNIHLDNNCIADKGAQLIAAANANNKFRKLDLGFNSLTSNGVKHLMKSLSESTTIQTLSISGTLLDTDAAKAVAYGLVNNRSLTSLFLDNCNIGNTAKRHIVAGIFSNDYLKLSMLTGFGIGEVARTLGLPPALEQYPNEKVLKFVHLMWDLLHQEQDLDPLHSLPPVPGEEQKGPNTSTRNNGPLNPSTVVAVAKRALDYLTNPNNQKLFLNNPKNGWRKDPQFDSPLAKDAILIEANDVFVDNSAITSTNAININTSISVKSRYMNVTDTNNDNINTINSTTGGSPCPRIQHHDDAQRRRRNVEWLCHNIHHLNDLSQLPFNPNELWRLHQYFYSPVNHTSGDVLCSIPTSTMCNEHTSEYTSNDLTLSAYNEHKSNGPLAPVSDPTLVPTNTLSMIKRKVSYRSLSDALVSSTALSKPTHRHQTVSKMIEEGLNGNLMRPKSKRARQFKTRMAYFPRIKVKLEAHLEADHYKASILMRQLRYIENSFLSKRNATNNNNALTEKSNGSSSFKHMSGDMAKDTETILIDMM